MINWFLNGDYAAAPLNPVAMLLGLLLALLCGQVMAWLYMWTHAGLSYSRSFVKSLVLIPLIVALVMFVLSNSLVTAFGLMAVFAIVRFRNVLRDTMDTAYMLAVIVFGMACGTQKFTSAIIGCLFTAAVLLYLRLANFGNRYRYDLILNLHWARPLADAGILNQLLRRHSFKSQCASQRSSEGEGADFSFRLLLRDPQRVDDLVRELRAIDGISRVTTLNAEDESEL